jgi:alkylation response protein AidB-like acyl-CoA dehydrogenase
MDLFLNQEEQMIQEMACAFSREELAKIAQSVDEEEEIPSNIKDSLFKLGFMGMLVPENYGGSKAGAVGYSIALTEIARGCASTAVIMMVTNMVAEAVNQFGSGKQKEKYLPPLLSGEIGPGAFALTEPGAGSDAGGISSTAVKQGGCYLLNGTKMFVTNGDIAGLILVMAVTRKEPREISAFLVEPSFKGLYAGKREKKLGLKGSSTVSLTFDNMEIPEENLLGSEGNGFKIAMSALYGGRIGIASQCVGISLAAQESSIAHSKERVQFGGPISQQGAIRCMIADSATEIEGARMLTIKAALKKNQGKRFTLEASMAKLFASEMAFKVCNRALQIYGGYGYMTDYPLERHLRDVKVATIYEGTSEIQRLVISRELLG